MKISKDQRNKLIGVGIGAAAAVFGLWYILIRTQEATLAEVAQQTIAAHDREQQIQQGVKVAQAVKDQLQEATGKMTATEQQMASGDLYSWMYNTIKDFKAGYQIEIPQFGNVSGPSDCSLLYKFPFKQVRMEINGKGYFHDIGKFIADFENKFPYMRVQNLDLSPIGNRSSLERDREKLTFRMDIIALVKQAESK